MLRDDVERAECFRSLLSAANVEGRAVVVSGQPADWGAGLQAVLERKGEVAAFHDLFSKTGDASYEGRPVLLGRELETRSELPVVFCSMPRYTWFTASPPSPQRCHWLVSPNDWQLKGFHQPALLEESGELIEQLHGLLADEESRATLAALVRARLDGDTGFYRIARYREYAHPLVSPRGGDIVIDGGAYDGDTAELFARNLDRRGRVYAFEPSRANYIKMWQRVQQKQLSNVVPLCQGLWREDAVLSFEDEQRSCSRVSDKGTVEVPVTSLDGFVQRMKLPRVDAIKLDVEGAEMAILEGARRTLERFRPKLMISIYHKREDFVAIPMWIASQLPNYVFYMGHHNYCNAETDVYAIPRERLVKERVRGAFNMVRKRAARESERLVFQAPRAFTQRWK